MMTWLLDNPILPSILALAILSGLIALLLGYAQVRFHVEGDPLVDKIDLCLPQTQCGQCGFPGCRPYAEAIAQGEVINLCPPGGESTVQALADLLGRDPLPLDAEDSQPQRRVAYIIEEECIGCTKCIQACPVDAIMGATRLMHTVIASECTGCDLCVEPCPVDCIEMRPVETKQWIWPLPAGPSADPGSRIIVTDRSTASKECA